MIIDSKTHLIVLWCNECKKPIGTTIINIGDTLEDGINYWFGNEVQPGTHANGEGQYICPNCNKGTILFWCPMSNDDDRISKLNYDPYVKYIDPVSEEDAEKFKDWIMTRV